MSADDNRLYKVLGIEPKATHDQIKKAYRKLAAEYHPDKGGDHDRFAEISKAYKTLVNPETRETYDSTSQLEIIAKQNISQAMAEFINKSIENTAQPVSFKGLVEHFKTALRQDENTLDQVKQKQKRLRKMKGKVKLKSCNDVYVNTLKKVSAGLKHDIRTLLGNIELLKKINELLVDYEEDVEIATISLSHQRQIDDFNTYARRQGL